MSESTAIGAYRATIEIAEFTGSAIGEDGLPKDGSQPTGRRLVVGYFEADGTEITDPARLAEMDARIAQRTAEEE